MKYDKKHEEKFEKMSLILRNVRFVLLARIKKVIGCRLSIYLDCVRER